MPSAADFQPVLVVGVERRVAIDLDDDRERDLYECGDYPALFLLLRRKLGPDVYDDKVVDFWTETGE